MHRLRNYLKNLNGSNWTQIGLETSMNTDLLLQEQYRHQTRACGGKIYCPSAVNFLRWLLDSIMGSTLQTELEIDSEWVRARNRLRMGEKQPLDCDCIAA